MNIKLFKSQYDSFNKQYKNQHNYHHRNYGHNFKCSNKNDFIFKNLKTYLIAALVASSLSGCSTFSNQNVFSYLSSNTSKTIKLTDNNQLYKNDSSRHEYRLVNGLQVIIKEDHRSPVAMTQIWYNVGSTDEPEDKGGISHLLEHMMFKGTDKVSGSDFDQLIAKFGGNHNAFTSYDYTGYYEMFPVNRLELALELEADRMTNLRFDSDEFIEEFTQERNVVMEERRQRTDDNPLARAFEEFRALALPDSPKGESIIGPMEEIANTSIEDLEKWYKTWYAPNNATLVIVGDVNPDVTIKKVEKYFAHLKPKKLPQRSLLQQKGWRGYQKKTIKESVNIPTLVMGFNVPTLPIALATEVPEQEIYDLLMLQFILDGGYAARFETTLVRDNRQLASISSHYDLFERGDSLFMIQATPRENISLQNAQDVILNQINKIKSENISDSELERARNNVVKGFVFAQDSVSGQAYTIGSMKSRGLDDRLISTLKNKLDKVDSKRINAIAKKYLVEENLTSMHIEPSDF